MNKVYEEKRGRSSMRMTSEVLGLIDLHVTSHSKNKIFNRFAGMDFVRRHAGMRAKIRSRQSQNLDSNLCKIFILSNFQRPRQKPTNIPTPGVIIQSDCMNPCPSWSSLSVHASKRSQNATLERIPSTRLFIIHRTFDKSTLL
jgi:hypothetical protein